MAKYLTTVTETYRVDTENEVEELIETAKKDGTFELKKYNREYKVRKKGGEIMDEYFAVSLVKVFNDPKEPISYVEINYEVQ